MCSEYLQCACAVCSVQCAVCSVQCAVCSVHVLCGACAVCMRSACACAVRQMAYWSPRRKPLVPSIGSSTHVRPVADQPSTVPLSPRSSAAHLVRTCKCIWHAHAHAHAHALALAAQFQMVRGARVCLGANTRATEELRVDTVRSAAARIARGRGDHSGARRVVRGEQLRRCLLGNEAVLLAQTLRVRVGVS